MNVRKLVNVCQNYGQEYTLCLKKTSHFWLAITLRHRNGFWFFFGRNVTDEVRNQKTYYYATSNNLCFCTTWQNGGTQNRIFSQMLYQCIAWIQSAVWLLQSFWLTTHTHDAVWLPNLVINAFSLQGCWGRGSGERTSRALQKLDYVACTVHHCAVFWVSYFAR